MTRKCTLHLGNVIRGITGLGSVHYTHGCSPWYYRTLVGTVNVHYTQGCNARD